MEVYTLDDLFRRTGTVVDDFESLVWTERFRGYGDFVLEVFSTPEAKRRFAIGTRLAMNESNRVMTIETREDKFDSEGNKVLSLSGRSIEIMLDNRVAKKTLTNTTVEPKWVITDTPAAIARFIFHYICQLGTLDARDVIPNVSESTFMPASNIPEPTDVITVELDPTTVYAVTQDICGVWNLGFRLLRQTDSPQLYYDIYSGSDRTNNQSILPPVVFSPALDNLQNISELTSMETSKNVAYVFSPAGFQMVTSDGVDPSSAGFERHILLVNATDITTDDGNGGTRTTTEITDALIQRGKEELAKNKGVSNLDGEISQDSVYKYGQDYFLGDLVTMQNDDGIANSMRIEEQIFVSDKQGERSYPTLTLDTLLVPKTWSSWEGNKDWADLTDEHWVDE